MVGDGCSGGLAVLSAPTARPRPTPSEKHFGTLAALMRYSLTEDEFTVLAAAYPVVPVALEVLGDRDTPVSVFEKLVGDHDGFLLESVERGERWARWSFVGWEPVFTLTAAGGLAAVAGGTVELPEGDPLAVLSDVIGRYATPPVDVLGLGSAPPPLHGGAVGYLSYDMVRYIERLPDRPEDDRGLPEMVWQFTGALAALDALRDTVLLIRNVFVEDDPAAQYRRAVASLEADAERLATGAGATHPAQLILEAAAAGEANIERADFEAAVARAIDYIESGDAFQIVPSVRFSVGFDGDAFAVYRALRLINPSPFMYFFRHGSLAIAGSSPELMTRVRDGVVYSRPIAGTRPRGETPDADAALEAELLADEKELAEHVMLVDLARNDVGRVCEFGTVGVDELMVVERYSHVMHIVSGVSGRLRAGLGPVDVLRATFPHGTVTGAPKVRAMEIIDELEPTARGPYAGAIGYIDFSGNVDTAIGLRTMIADGTMAWVQAGAGVVADSVPGAEYEECVAKAAAVLTAIAAASRL
jgi:anthranilate synthase component I